MGRGKLPKFSQLVQSWHLILTLGSLAPEPLLPFVASYQQGAISNCYSVIYLTLCGLQKMSVIRPVIYIYIYIFTARKEDIPSK